MLAVKKPADIFDAYAFRQSELQTLALTHASAGGDDNERLEWLGDALLDFVVGDLLYARHPRLSEGELTQARAQLVGGKALAGLARDIGLPNRLRMSAAEARGGGRGRDSILAGAMEAYFAAVYLDGGIAAAKRLAAMLFDDLLSEVDGLIGGGGDMLKDGKTRLQELLQKHGLPPPHYEVLERGGGNARPYCVAECRLDSDSKSDSKIAGKALPESERRAVAVAANRREAEQLAGRCLLALLLAKAKKQ